MAKKQQLFKTTKEVKKTLQQNVLESVVAAGSGVGIKIAYDAFKNKLPEKTRKFGPIGLMGVGIAGNVYAKDPYVKAAALGACSTAGLSVVNELASPEIQAKIGFNPLGAVDSETQKNVDELFRQIEDELNDEQIDDEFDDEFDDI